MTDPHLNGTPDGESDRVPRSPNDARPLWVLAGLSAFAVLFTLFGQYLQLDYLATQESELREFQSANPWLVYGIAFAVYVLATGLSLPGAAALTLVYGWYFGFKPALLIVSFASTAGATIAFLISRYLLHHKVQTKFGDRLTAFNHHLEEEGAFYLFTLRLIPLLPFFVINLVMGLTPIRTRTYWWVSQLGMLPGTMVYVHAGTQIPHLTQLAEEGIAAVFSPHQLFQITIAFGLLGIFPVVAKLMLKALSNR